jgi:hypothetical protein
MALKIVNNTTYTIKYFLGIAAPTSQQLTEGTLKSGQSNSYTLSGGSKYGITTYPFNECTNLDYITFSGDASEVVFSTTVVG